MISLEFIRSFLWTFLFTLSLFEDDNGDPYYIILIQYFIQMCVYLFQVLTCHWPKKMEEDYFAKLYVFEFL